MGDDTWYRPRTWSDEDQAAFFAKLQRSRSGFHKAQYCRIQAYELQQAGSYKAALQLLDLLLAEWPTDAQKAAAFHQRAMYAEKLGDTTRRKSQESTASASNKKDVCAAANGIAAPISTRQMILANGLFVIGLGYAFGIPVESAK